MENTKSEDPLDSQTEVTRPVPGPDVVQLRLPMNGMSLDPMCNELGLAPESTDSPPKVHQAFDRYQGRWNAVQDPTAFTGNPIWPFIVCYRWDPAGSERVVWISPRDRDLIASLGSTLLDNNTQEGMQLLVSWILIAINR
jgi:hypothetical protein